MSVRLWATLVTHVLNSAKGCILHLLESELTRLWLLCQICDLPLKQVQIIAAPVLHSKVQKSVHFRCVSLQICEAFGANRYPFPEEPARQRQMNAEVTARLRELHTTIEAGQSLPLFCIPKTSPQHRKAFLLSPDVSELRSLVWD